MRALFFARDDGDFDVAEAGLFEQLMQLHFAETEPVIGVKFARSFELVAEQIENDDAAALFENAMRGRRSRARDESRDAAPG